MLHNIIKKITYVCNKFHVLPEKRKKNVLTVLNINKPGLKQPTTQNVMHIIIHTYIMHIKLHKSEAFGIGKSIFEFV